MHKKAQLDTTISWFAGFIVIFFIMLIYFGFVGVALPQKAFDRNKISNLENIDKLSEKADFLGRDSIDLSVKPKDLLQKFIDENKESIYNFVDSDNVMSGGYYMNYVFVGKVGSDINTEKIYLELFDIYSAFISDKNLNEPYFYIRTGNKEMQINQGSWSMNHQEGAFFNTLRVDDENSPDYINENKYFFITDEGNLFMIIFYEKDEVYKDYE